MGEASTYLVSTHLVQNPEPMQEQEDVFIHILGWLMGELKEIVGALKPL